ncbi:MAG: hypothetical protein ACREOH_05695, partial [Candidatus Entotheonellia bacterium]
MRKLSILAVLVMLVGLVAISGGVAGPNIAAADTQTLNWGSEVNAGQCPSGNLVINVTHKVINGIDSGVVEYWATEDYNRHIQVWQVDTDEFCAIVAYNGSFVTDDGASPQGTDTTIATGITGTFEGGY